jgi:hypothetical protein
MIVSYSIADIYRGKFIKYERQQSTIYNLPGARSNMRVFLVSK